MRSKSMQALTDSIKARHPGVTIYGIGDAAHKTTASDHNEDDTAGVRSGQTDSDNVKEHRAVDVMLGARFSKADANRLVSNLVSNGTSNRRLFYVIFNGKIWRRNNGWSPETYNGSDKHTGHIHISGFAGDDDNAAPWPQVAGTGPAPKTFRQLADEVMAGDWGNGDVRKTRLTAAGYDYDAVQAEVNRRVHSESITEIAREVIAGRWGNGAERKERLTKSGYNYDKVQAEVNRLFGH